MVKARARNLTWDDSNMPDLDLVKLISHFLYTKKAEGRSPKTISWYEEMLLDFVRFLRSTGRQTVLAEFSAATVREFIVHEQERGMSPFTVRGKGRTLKVLASWLLSEGYTPNNLLANVKLPKAPVVLVEPLTDAEINALISARNPLTATGYRDSAILTTFLDNGIRLSELSNLRFENAHIYEGYLKVRGKGNKERIVPVGSLARRALWRYVFHFRPQPVTDADDSLFLTLNGGRLSSNAVKLLLDRWGKRAGVPRLHAHPPACSALPGGIPRLCGRQVPW